MWTSEAPTLSDYTNDSSIDWPWSVDLGETQEKFSKKFLRFLSMIMLFLRRLRLSDTGRWLVSIATPFIQNKNSSKKNHFDQTLYRSLNGCLWNPTSAKLCKRAPLTRLTVQSAFTDTTKVVRGRCFKWTYKIITTS